MKKSTKAALLSALIFPGIGHIVLKQRLRGWALVLVTLVAVSVIVNSVVQRALAIVDRINSGEMPVDTAAIADMVSNSGSSGDGSLEGTALIVLGVCWLIGVVDSYRLGIAQEK